MTSESMAHSAFDLMGYWLRAHSGSRNDCEIFLTMYDVQSSSALLNNVTAWKVTTLKFQRLL